MMDHAHFEWVALPGSPACPQKLLGVFTERRTQAGLLQARRRRDAARRAAASMWPCGRGRVAAQPLRPLTTVFLEHGEEASITAEQETELIHFGLPDLRGLESQPAYTAEAAE